MAGCRRLRWLRDGYRQRAHTLVATANPTGDVAARLVLAADAFVTTKPDVVAGYPWFGAWSRDTMTSYEGLFRMLSAGRFDALSRSSSEVVQEFAARGKDLPGVVIEKHLLLHYPMPAYFWFPNTEDGHRRAERVRIGLIEMIEDGTLQGLFDQEFAPLIKRLDMDHRLVLELSNPLLGDNDPLGDSSLWYKPGGH